MSEESTPEKIGNAIGKNKELSNKQIAVATLVTLSSIGWNMATHIDQRYAKDEHVKQRNLVVNARFELVERRTRLLEIKVLKNQIESLKHLPDTDRRNDAIKELIKGLDQQIEHLTKELTP